LKSLQFRFVGAIGNLIAEIFLLAFQFVLIIACCAKEIGDRQIRTKLAQPRMAAIWTIQ